MDSATPNRAGDVRLELRPYQREALDRTTAAEARGVRRQLGVAATGLGKTVMFCALAERRQERALILAHRDELVSQAEAKVREVWPAANVGVVKAERDERNADVVIASVQTLAREKRLARFVGSHGSLFGPNLFGLVVVDEAHHTAADSYRRILDALNAGADDGPLLLGVTATPDRGDGKGLDDLYDEIVWNYDVLWGIRAGFLSDVRGLRITLDNLDMSEVKVRRGDYEAGAAGQALEDADAPALIVKAWTEHAAGRQTIVFTPTVATAELVAEKFNAAGVRAGMVHGGTPLEERRALLAAYERGDVQVVSNCMVLTEGFDSPATDCIVMARPTRSRALYTQCVGRGTRRHPGKADLLVLDVVGASESHSLVTIPSLFGVGEQEWADKLGDGSGLVTSVLDERDAQLVKLGKLRAEEADLFRQLRGEGIAWVSVMEAWRDGRRKYVRPLGRDANGAYLPTVALVQVDEAGEFWTAQLEHNDGAEQVLIDQVAQSTAQGVAEDYVRANAAHSALISTDAPWRKRPPTAKQLEAARKWRMPDPGQYQTAGELSEALDAWIAQRKASRRGRSA